MKSASVIAQTPVTTLERSEYGALDTSQVLTPVLQQQLKVLLAQAVKTGNLPSTYTSRDKRQFQCMNHDTYDVCVFRGKVKGLVVQARYFWKDLRKGHTRSQKSYFLVMRAGKKVTVTELENATCVKRAKNTTSLGQLVNHYCGKKPVACKPMGPVSVSVGYKVLAKTEDGSLVSAFDDSAYKLGTWRIEAAKPSHGGGFYFYANKELAVDATRRGVTFADCVSEGKLLVLCEIEYAGKQIAYSDGKFAATRLRVLKEMELVVLENDE